MITEYWIIKVENMTSEYWIIGGEFSSLNFHGLLPNTEIVRGPFRDKLVATQEWQELSATHRHKAGYRFVITETHF